MALEIERKFYLPYPPKFLDELEHRTIRQGYVAIQENGNAVRVRQIDNEYWLTAKSTGELSRKEVEFSLAQNVFLELWELTEGKRIEKHRYQLDHGDVQVEIDVFQGNLFGLILAEVEFNSINQANHFVAPSWIGKEVTTNPLFKNRNLAAITDYSTIVKLL